MSTHEQLLWRYVRARLRLRGHAVRVENPLDPGMPDVSYACPASVSATGAAAEGWLELKVAPAVARRDTIIRTRVSAAQRAWWRERAARGGRVRVLLRIVPAQREMEMGVMDLILDGPDAAAVLGHVDRAALLRCAIDHWDVPHKVDGARLWRALTLIW